MAGGCESLPLSESFPEMTEASPPHTAPGFPRSHDAGDFSGKSFTKCLLSANIGEHFLPSCSFGPWVGSSYSAVRATDTLTAVLSCVVFLSVCVCVFTEEPARSRIVGKKFLYSSTGNEHGFGNNFEKETWWTLFYRTGVTGQSCLCRYIFVREFQICSFDAGAHENQCLAQSWSHTEV